MTPNFALRSGALRLTAISAALAVTASFAWADDSRVDGKGERYKLVSCHKNVEVPAQYKVSKKLIKKPHRKYVQRGHVIELREYPAVYKEIRTKVRDAYIVLKEVPCANK